MPDGDFLIEISPKAEEAVDDALALAQRGKTKKAWEILTRLLREYPRNHHVYFGMGTVHVVQGDLPEAIEWFDKAIAIFPYMIEAHYNKAGAYRDMRDIPNCVRAYRKVVELAEPDDPEGRKAQSFLDDLEASLLKHEGVDLDIFLTSNDQFERAFDCMQHGQWQQALDGFLKVVVANDRNVATHGNLGMCYAQLGYKAKALAELDRALELDPRYKIARTNRKVVEKMTEGCPIKASAFRFIKP